MEQQLARAVIRKACRVQSGLQSSGGAAGRVQCERGASLAVRYCVFILKNVFTVVNISVTDLVTLVENMGREEGASAGRERAVKHEGLGFLSSSQIKKSWSWGMGWCILVIPVLGWKLGGQAPVTNCGK